MYITLYFLVTRLPESLRAVRTSFSLSVPPPLTVDLLEKSLLAAEKSIVAVGASRGDPRTPIFEGCSPSPLLPSVAFAAAWRRVVVADGGGGSGGARVAVAAGVAAEAGGGGGGGSRSGTSQRSSTAVWSAPAAAAASSALATSPPLISSVSGTRSVSVVGRSAPAPTSFAPATAAGEQCGGTHTARRCFARLTDAWRQQFPEASEIPRWGELSRAGVAIFDLDYDAILAAMYAVTVSDEGDCYRCFPPDAGHCRPVAVSLADPSGGSCPVSFLYSPPVSGGSLWHPDWSLPPFVLYEPGAPAGCPSLLPVSSDRGSVADASHGQWGPCPRPWTRSRALLPVVVDDYSRYTTVFPLRSKGDVTEVLIDWIRAARLRLRQSFGSDFPVLRLHSDRGGEFSSGLLRAYCSARGIRQTFTLSDSPQQNGIAERHIGMVMDVARTSMMHAAAPHFLWPFAVSPAVDGEGWRSVGVPGLGSRAFVRDLSADKLSPRAAPCVFLGFPLDAPGWQFYHPTSRRVLSSQDVTFDESVPYYRLFPYRTPSLPPPLLFLVPGRRGRAVEVTGDSGAAVGAEPGGAVPGGAGSGGAESGGAEPGGAEPGGAEPGVLSLGVLRLEVLCLGGAEPGGAAVSGLLGAGGVLLVLEVLLLPRVCCCRGSRRCSYGSTGAAGPAGSPGAGAAEGVGAETTTSGSTGGAPGAAGGSGATGGAAGGSGATGGAARRWSRFASASPPVPGTHRMSLHPSTAPLRAPLPSPPSSSLPALADPESDSLRAASPTVTRLLATAVTDPSFESSAASSLVTELVDFAARCRLDYAAGLVAESESTCPPSVGGECALGTDVLEDRQEEFQCLAAVHLISRLGMWIFRVKRPPGSPPVFKARYVARGFS
ncbi:unnamed protein product [Closterium sp. NIES-65]|nr:unnamed protein product [Closterium sp. NIES-65]